MSVDEARGGGRTAAGHTRGLAPGLALGLALDLAQPRGRLEIGFVHIDGIRLRVGVRRGRGRPLLLFNAFGARIETLAPLIAALDGVEVIVFDTPGVGGSPALLRPRRFAALARLGAALLARLGCNEPVNVAGLAWGGALAQQFALDHPRLTNRLVLAASSAGLLGLPPRRGILKRLNAARRYRRRQTLPEIAPALYGGLTRQRPELLKRRVLLTIGPSTRGIINQLLGGLGWTSVHRLYNLRCPTLVMAGDDDPVLPLASARLLYWLIPAASLHIVRGGGHLFLTLRAHESAAVIKRFVAERRFDGTDEQDFLPARDTAPDDRITLLTRNAASTADAQPARRWPVDG